MKSAYKVLKEQVNNYYLIQRLSLYEIKDRNRNNFLGMTWEIINPIIQVLIYWFVFATVRNRAPIEMNGLEISFFAWVLAGFFLWIFCYQSIIQGSKSIYTRLRILSKMNFPMSIIPNVAIFSNLYIHFTLILLSILIIISMGYSISIYYVQFLYFIFAAVCFLFAVSLITSTISTILRDFHLFLNATFRMLLYLSGVLWPITLLSDYPNLMKIIMLNPIYYLIEGYRATFFGTEWYFLTHWQYSLYFWGITLILFLIGSFLHIKFRRHFIDYL